MDAWRLRTAAMVLALVSAGCIGGKDASEDEAVEVAEAAAAMPEGRGPILAFEETNATEAGAGGLEHHHDYWNGETRVTVLEKQVAFPISLGAPQTMLETVKPDVGQLVYEATGSVEVLAHDPTRAEGAADPTGAGGLTLLYKHAAATEWIEVGSLVWGSPLLIAVTNPAQTDMPHATYSLWEFGFRTDDVKMQGIAFDVKVDIVRGEGDVPLWPGHPAFYTDSHTRTVLDTDAQAGELGLTGDVAAPAQMPEASGELPAQKVISYGTRTLTVFVNVSDMQVANPIDTPTNFYLIFRNASGEFNSTDMFDVDGKHPASQKEHVWTLRVDDAGMDSPYAESSRWRFELAAAFARNTPVVYFTCYRGCATWSADYHITVVASDVELAPEAYEAYESG